MNRSEPISPVVLVHGGAWKIPDEMIEESEQGVRQAVIEGFKVLKSGGTSVDAVVKAVSSLEDNPAFDAGRGSVMNAAGDVEMHALVMRGDTCDVGGVLCIQHVRNPVQVARIVLDESAHCLVNGEAGLKMARKHHLPEESKDYFVTEHAKEEFKLFPSYSDTVEGLFNGSGHDTVGAVALDCHGNLACATSTGGITAQQVGRVSDSPIVGSGGFADNQSVAVSTTGHGESIMKVNLARMISFHVENGMDPKQATIKSLEKMESRVGGRGGAISVDASGRAGVYHTSERMSWAKIDFCDDHPQQDKRLAVDHAQKRFCGCRQLKGVCTREYQPVCADNGEKFGNFCLLCEEVGRLLKDDGKLPFYYAGEAVKDRCDVYLAPPLE